MLPSSAVNIHHTYDTEHLQTLHVLRRILDLELLQSDEILFHRTDFNKQYLKVVQKSLWDSSHIMLWYIGVTVRKVLILLSGAVGEEWESCISPAGSFSSDIICL